MLSQRLINLIINSTHHAFPPGTEGQITINAKIEYDNKEAERDALEIQVRILCMDYEGVANVCEWKRKSQSNSFDKGRFKVLNEADYLNPIYQGSSLGSVKPVLVAWKAY